MTTLISFHTSCGNAGRCDARCHNAKHPKCTCICGGRNHGVGHDQAIENTRRMADEMIEQYARAHNVSVTELGAHVNAPTVYQLVLL